MRAFAAEIGRAARTAASGLLELLLANTCAGCGETDATASGLCDACNERLLSLVALPYCPRCGTTVGPNIPVWEEGCSACPQPLPRFVRVHRLGPYTRPLRRAIQQMKYRRREVLRGRLGRLLAEAAAPAHAEAPFDLVVPVPMHWLRRIQRGYDHARVLAEEVARTLRVAVGCELIRTRNTRPQVGLGHTGRIENVRGAFRVASRRAVEGANILLVDDVTTTGATASEAARTLLRGEALRVSLAVVAKSEAPTAYGRHWRGDDQPGEHPSAAPA